MTEPRPSRPAEPESDGQEPATGDRFADLDRRPVSEHVAVFEAEHARLQDELSTIDEL
jgi:hypothetical protein